MSLFDGPRGLAYSTPRLKEECWYALRTRARMEKRSAAYLRAAGVEADAMVAETYHHWSDRLQLVGTPLFSGYIFARFTLAGIALPLSYPGIVGVVRTKGIPVPVRDSEIAAVRRLAKGVSATGELPTEVTGEETIGGRRVFVVSGPFEGLTGILIESRGRGCVAVQIEAIRQIRAVHLESAAIAVLPDGEGGADGIASPESSSSPAISSPKQIR